MSESAQRAAVLKALRPLHAVPVENPALPGTPDVNYIDGWIELKQLPRWPTSGNIVKVRHFTPQQRLFLRLRRAKNGKAWVLLRVKLEWLLFDGAVAAEKLGNVTKQELRELAVMRWAKGLDGKELLAFLRRENGEV